MVGYDEEEQCVYVHDCGKAEVQKITVSDLERALDIQKTELSDKNTICCPDFSGEIKDIRKIAVEGFKLKAKAMLYPPVGFVGIPGMRKLAKDILNWEKQLTTQEYREALINITMFTGTVPLLPDKLSGYKTAEDVTHCAVRDGFGVLLVELGNRYGFPGWVEAGGLFLRSGAVIENMTDYIVEYLLGNRGDLKELPDMINQIADLEEEAYRNIDSIEDILSCKEKEHVEG
jgi:hypothetical protein